MKHLAKIVITIRDYKSKYADFNCSKTAKHGIALKKALYDADLFIAENSIPMRQDSRTNISDIMDYIISSPAIYSNIQNLFVNNYLSSDH